MKDFINRYSSEINIKIVQTSIDILRSVQKKKELFFNKEWKRNDWLLVFALATIVGIAGKTIAIKTITIGYQDYSLKQTDVHTPITSSHITQGPLCEE